MKLTLLIILLSFTLFGQDTIEVVERTYLDKNTLMFTDFTSCDSNQTIRVVYDYDISTTVSSILSERYKKFEVFHEDIVEGNNYFIKRAAIDSNKNVLAINIFSNGLEDFIQYIICNVESDNEIMTDLLRRRTKKIYVNYFQVISKNNEQSEFIAVTVERRMSMEKYLLFNKKE
jgi:hypothetical protein